MKQLIVVFLLLGLSRAIPANAIEWEVRAGSSASGIWGLHAAALMSMPLSEHWNFRTGVWLHTVDKENYSWDKCNIHINIPMYAAYRLPIGNQSHLRLEAGPYVGAANYFQVGPSAGIGIERSHWSIGTNYFQNCINEKGFQFHISVGYNFSL